MTPSELIEWRQQVDASILEAKEHRKATDEQLHALHTDLKTNTDATQRVEQNTSGMVEMMESWQGAMRVLGYIGRMAKPAAYIVGLGTALMTFWGTLKGGLPK